MKLRQIEALRAVMITGSVTQAAEMLHVSQPAVSRLVAELERDVGFKLFARERRRLVPTEEGRSLYAEVRRAFVGLDQIERAAKAIRTFGIGRVRVACMPMLSSVFLPGVICEFARTYPEISISLEVQPRHVVLDWVSSNLCDIGLATLPSMDPAIRVETFYHGDVVCILPPGHRLAERPVIRASDLEGEAFVSYCQNSEFRSMVDRYFDTRGVHRVIRIEARTAEAVYGLVQGGLGVSVIAPVISHRLPADRIVVRPLDPVLSYDIALLWPAYRPQARVSALFGRAVVDYARAHDGAPVS